MANRSMTAKAARVAKQKREAAQGEFSKPLYLGGRPKVPPYDVAMVQRLPPGRYQPAEGKGKRVASSRCYGDGTRKKLGLTFDIYVV